VTGAGTIDGPCCETVAMVDHDGAQRAIALLTVALADDDLEPQDDVVAAVAPDLGDADESEALIRGLAEVSAWLLMHLEELSSRPAQEWLRQAALEFNQ
jgi:hypothetical protein